MCTLMTNPAPQRTNPHPRRNWLAGILVLSAGIVVLGALAVAAGAFGTQASPDRAALGAPRFVEEAGSAGVAHAYEGGFAYYVGGGVAVFDCDGDARPDLYFAGGSAPAALFANRSQAGGGLAFERVAGSGAEFEAVTGVYPIDIDSDGLVDLAVLRRGENLLLRGRGGCRFERANEAWGFHGGAVWSTAFSATWERGVGWPTLAIGNYLDEATPSTYRCFDNQLVRPIQDRAFGPPVALRGWCTLSMLFSSWDRSGRADLRVSNDRHYYLDTSAGQEQLWRVAALEQPREYGPDDGWQRLRVWGMGIASHDLTGDGYPEYYLTSQGDNKLQVLAGGPDSPHFVDIALARGVTAHRPFTGGDNLPSTAWHAEFGDVNNDALVDLFVAKGNVEGQADHAGRDPNNLFLGQPDGTFVEGADAAGIVHFDRTRGAALVDLNADGLLDLVEVERVANVRLWRNVGQGTPGAAVGMGRWLAVVPRQAGPNRDAIGGWVQVRSAGRVVEREVVIGGGHAGGQLGPLHFGLAGAAEAEVRVIWPDGTDSGWRRHPANRVVTIER
jgi:enediyne biosynthesis protein E4